MSDKAKAPSTPKSETKTTPAPTEAKTSTATASKTATESSTPPSDTGISSSRSSSNTIQNGKGDGPRNISPRFRKNYEGIRWASGGKARQEGSKFVKVYA